MKHFNWVSVWGKQSSPPYKAGCCFHKEGLLLERFRDCNRDSDGGADHGVVAHAQEAHHFHVKSAWRRLCACGAGTFWAGSPTFRKTRSTSPESVCCAFPLGLILSHHLFTKQDVLTFLYNSHHHFFICHHRSSSPIISYHLPINPPPKEEK